MQRLLCLAACLALSSCFTAELEGLPCDGDHPCIAAHACVAGECVDRDALTGCGGPGDCADDERCDDGVCVPRGVDDAGTPDDAGAPDDAGTGCVDPDQDGRGPGCAPGDDCAPDDEDAFASVGAFVDGDGDDATVGAAVTLCTDGTLPDGYAAAASATPDCDDDDPAIASPIVYFPDADGDGVSAGAGVAQCSSTTPANHLAAASMPPDNCPAVGNPTQDDGESDGVGDVCDVCPGVADPMQEDLDGDAAGDACDDDDDGDGALDVADNCPRVANAGQENADGDAKGDACDACPAIPDTDAADTDGDGLGDPCDDDDDGDAIPDATDVCDLVVDPAQGDEDADGVGDACDNCPLDANPAQEDVGDATAADGGVDPDAGADAGPAPVGDGVGDVCDPRPTTPGDVVLLADGFAGDALDARWTAAEADDQWGVAGGDLVQSQQNDSAALAATLDRADVVIDAIATLNGTQGAGNQLGLFARGADGVDGVACLISRDGGNAASRGLYTLDAQGPAQPEATENLATQPAAGATYRLRLSVVGATFSCTTAQTTPTVVAASTSTTDVPTATGARAGFFTNQASAAFDAIVVYGRSP